MTGGLVDATDGDSLMLFLAGFSLVGLALAIGVRRECAPSRLAEEEVTAETEAEVDAEAERSRPEV